MVKTVDYLNLLLKLLTKRFNSSSLLKPDFKSDKYSMYDVV